MVKKKKNAFRVIRKLLGFARPPPTHTHKKKPFTFMKKSAVFPFCLFVCALQFQK